LFTTPGTAEDIVARRVLPRPGGREGAAARNFTRCKIFGIMSAMAKPTKKRASPETPRAIPLAKATEQRARLASAQADLAVAELKWILGLLSGLQKATETGGFREPLPPKSLSPNVGGT
jgi:hypothetical protein